MIRVTPAKRLIISIALYCGARRWRRYWLPELICTQSAFYCPPVTAAKWSTTLRATKRTAAAMVSDATVTSEKLKGGPIRLLPSHCTWRVSITSSRNSGLFKIYFSFSFAARPARVGGRRYDELAIHLLTASASSSKLMVSAQCGLRHTCLPIL